MRRNDDNMDELQALKQYIQDRKSTVAIASAADKQILMAVKEAVSNKYCSFLLFDVERKIIELAELIELDLSLPQIQIMDTVSSKTASEAVKAIRSGRANILMKGNISTKTILQEVLNKESGLRTSNVLSHVALFEIPSQGRLIFLTDAAMNIQPTLQQKVDIIHNAVQVAQKIGVKIPKVAALASVEVVNESMPATLDAALLAQMAYRGQITGCEVDGPLAFDVAVSNKATEHKNITSNVAGKADILLVPNIEVGNALYKSFIYFANAKVASIISGAKAPIVLTSRSDSAESKMYSLLLALATS